MPRVRVFWSFVFFFYFWSCIVIDGKEGVTCELILEYSGRGETEGF